MNNSSQMHPPILEIGRKSFLHQPLAQTLLELDPGLAILIAKA
jgi:hypothetical protein